MRHSFLMGAVCAAVVALAWPETALAEGKFICAISEAQECTPTNTCKRVTPQQINIAPMMELDLDKKEIVSAAMTDRGRKETIEGVKVVEKALYLHGQQDEETWSAVISRTDGTMTASISAAGTGFVLFGNCAPK